MHLSFFPFFLLCYEVAVYFSHDMYMVAIPQITEFFSIGDDQAKVTFILWSLGAGSLQLLLGPLCTAFGRRRLLLLSCFIFTLSSYACAISESFLFFCLARFVQGTAVGSIFVAGYTTIHTLYSGRTIIAITSMMNAVTLVAPALGPVLGAWLISYYQTWTSLFYTLIIFGVLAFAGLFATTPETATLGSMNLKKDFQDYRKILGTYDFLLKSFLGCLSFSVLFLWVIQSPFILYNAFGKDEFYYAYAQVAVFSSYIFSSLMVPMLYKYINLDKFLRAVLKLIGLSGLLLAVLGTFQAPLELQIAVACLIGAFGGLISSFLQRLVLESSPELPLSHKMALYSMFISLTAIIVGTVSVAFEDKDFVPLGSLYAFEITLALLLIRYSKPTFILRKEDDKDGDKDGKDDEVCKDDKSLTEKES